jgi:hypothetical protein
MPADTAKLDMGALFGKPDSNPDAGGPDDDFKDLCKTIFPGDDGSRCEALFEAIQNVVAAEGAEPPGMMDEAAEEK